MLQVREKTSAERLLEMVERYNLYHVKTLHYKDVQGVLEWLGVNCGNFTYRVDEDTVAVLDTAVRLHGLRDVRVVGIQEEPQLQGIDRVVVYIKRQCDPQISNAEIYDSVVLFLVIKCNTSVPYSLELTKSIKDIKKILRDSHPLFPTFKSCQAQCAIYGSQQTRPVIDGFVPLKCKTTTVRTSNVIMDNFGRQYETLRCTTEANPWSVYTNIPAPPGPSEFDIEKLIMTPNKVLGRGGFGVTVPIDNHSVAKINLFPDMVDWSVPFMDKQFSRYAHIASQVEEVMIGVSMKHPNILRTFGGFWCDSPGYQLGGRAVLVMERALFSLQEFMWRLKDTSVIPAVELDTLRGLDYLRSRTIQHRDFTYRNILVCHQPNRKPLPFAFKISDFGTSCNFSTPDQPRGNRTNMAPEVLWCLNAATGSDMFSWYCVMWELHSGFPLIKYKGHGQVYCKKTYAENLSNLVGVYSPEKSDTFELGYMKAMNARVIHTKYKDRRPSVQAILRSLKSMGHDIADKRFVSMGVHCITLFPQERYSPSQLLNLPHYKCLSRDISHAQLPPEITLPLSVQAGGYKTTDIIVSNDCIPEGLRELTESTVDPRVTVINPDSKVYYGIDFMRLAPDLIQPHEWYSKKVKELEDLYKSKYKKRKAGNTDNPVEVRRSKTVPEVHVDDPEEGTSTKVRGKAHQVPRQPTVTDVTQTPDREHELLSVLHNEAHGAESADRNRGHVSMEVSVFDFNNVEWSRESVGILSCSDVDDVILSSDSKSLASENSNRALDAVNSQFESGVDTLICRKVQRANIAASIEDAPRLPSESTADPVSKAVDVSPGAVILLGKKIKGEIDTTMVILKSRDEKEIARFKCNVILLSQTMTRMHPLIFDGPRDGLCKCSRSSGVFIFQYAQFFEGCKQALNWDVTDSPNSVHAFLLQLFLTLKLVVDMKLLPTHMTEWRDVLIGNGAVMIDIVPYLSRNFNKPRSSLFGEDCNNLVDLCVTMVEKHLPNSDIHKWLLDEKDLNISKSTSCMLTELIKMLRCFDRSDRTTPHLLTLHNGNYFTIRDYSSDIPNWLTCMGEEEEIPSGAKLLVYGDLKPFRGNQAADSLGDTKLNTLVKNIVLRLRVKILGSSRLEVTTLDCTQGLMKVTLKNSALSGISSLDQLDRSTLLNKSNHFTHDASSPTEARWAPVIMFTRHNRQGPLREFTLEYYRIMILMVLLSPHGLVRSLKELFQSVATFSVTDY